MKRILFSWIGQKDLNVNKIKEKPYSEPGPLISTLQAIKFSKCYLLYNYSEKEVEPYLNWLNDHKMIKHEASYANLTSPIAFDEIYPAVDQKLKQIIDENLGAQISILLSPGTPAMQAVSILLGKTKYSVDFIQASIEQGVQQINLPFDISAEFIPALHQQKDEQLNALSSGIVPDTAAFDNIITQNETMLRLKEQAAILATRDVPILIYGETGTGKELFARAIHNSSSRKHQSFIALNCGAIPPELIDTTLFGSKKGAFTGAVDSIGHFQEADGGTLFLDEFGELSLNAQVRLLRVLQENIIKRVGSNKEQAVDVRIIVATNQNLCKMVGEGSFREDLFYRVAVGVLNLPPLRERSGDLGILSEYLLEDINQKASTQTGYLYKKLSINAKNIIFKQEWPGNVRELYSTLLRGSLWCQTDQISKSDIKNALFEHNKNTENLLGKSLDEHFNIQSLTDEVRIHYIQKALSKTNGSTTKAAKLLGLNNYQTLSQWIEKYKLNHKP